MPNQAGKVLGIDYGNARIGLAISDINALIGSPLKILKNKGMDASVDAVFQLIQDEKIHEIIVGNPLGIDGNPTQMSGIIMQFIEKLKDKSHESGVDINIILWNETLTSHQAYDNLLLKGKTHEKIKGLLDAEAARIILQEYLDNKEQL